MPVSPYIVHALKYATLTLAVAVVVIAGAAILKGTPTASLTGRLVSPQQNGITPTLHIEAERSIDGFSVPADTNVIFTIPNNIRIPRITFLGGQDKDQEVRYWGYCYSGRESSNKAAGKRGSELYDGQFFYSLAERKAGAAPPDPTDSGLLGILKDGHPAPPERASIAEIFNSNETCYVMSSSELPAAIDTDGDDLNNKREQLSGTNPKDPDSDHDGISDGVEVFVTKTSPKDPDTDHDGLTDPCEDQNKNGTVDLHETSPFNADTDRDELCDGNGSGSGCPEKKQVVCTRDRSGEQVCDSRLTSPVYGEDMNQNCAVDEGETDPTNAETFGVNDWTYKWNLLGGTPNPGTIAPRLFPIPEFPQ